MENLQPYRWAKVKNGISNIAIVTLIVSKNDKNENIVNEYYDGNGFTSQGYIEEVPKEGYNSWKIGAIKGLEYAFSKTREYWIVDIISIKGISTQTNSTIVGYTIIKAFLDQINLELSKEEIDTFEEFISKSWVKPYQEFIPDFFTLTFTDYK